MAYTKDYYHILGLAAQSWGTKEQISTVEVRKAYRNALLAAHPDKTSAAVRKSDAIHTVDDVKEAYTVLVDPKSRSEYDNWLLHHGDTLRTSSAVNNSSAPSSDFVLGLELLDLSDFEATEPATLPVTAPPSSSSASSPNTSPNSGAGSDDCEGQMEWTRACRCGAEKGFRILEEELEDAESRGEKEVLVGCEGCSLWVRVAFDVEND